MLFYRYLLLRLLGNHSLDRDSLRTLRFEDRFCASDRGSDGILHSFIDGPWSRHEARSLDDTFLLEEHMLHLEELDSIRSPPQRPQVPRPDLRMREGGRLGVCPDAHLGRGVRFTGGTSRVLEGDSQREGGRGGH